MNDEDLKRIDRKLDNIEKDVKALMIFMAVAKANETKKNKHTAAIVSVICSVSSSGIMYIIAKYFGG